jgi:hypothetical protein
MIPKIQRVVDNRIRQAMRWHGCKTEAEVSEFVFGDADMQTLLDDAAAQEALGKYAIRKILDAKLAGDETRLAQLRAELGAEIMEAILAALDRAIAEQRD